MSDPTPDLTRTTAADLAAALAAGETTSVALTQAHLDRIAAVDGSADAGVHAPRGLQRNHNSWILKYLPAKNKFLQITPG